MNCEETYFIETLKVISKLIMHHFNDTETQWTYRGPWAFYFLFELVLNVSWYGTGGNLDDWWIQ